MAQALVDRFNHGTPIRCADIRVSVAREPGAGRVTIIDVFLDTEPRGSRLKSPHVMRHTLKTSCFAPEDFLDWIDKTLDLYTIAAPIDVSTDIHQPCGIRARLNGERSVGWRVARNCRKIISHAFDQHSRKPRIERSVAA